MNDYNGSSSKMGVVIVILLILIIAGMVYLFLNNKSNAPRDEVKENDNVVNNVKKVVFTKKVSGTSGDLYLSSDNKAYLVLSNLLSGDSISGLAQDFNVEKNDVYNSDTVKAILVVLPNVVDISYDSKEEDFNLKTKNDTMYRIDDKDIRINSRMSLEEIKEEQTNNENTGENNNINNQNNNANTNTNTNTNTNVVPKSGQDRTSSGSTHTETASGNSTGVVKQPGNQTTGSIVDSARSSSTGSCDCADGTKGLLIAGICSKVTTSCETMDGRPGSTTSKQNCKATYAGCR